MNVESLDWNDFRVVLAIAEAGSLAGAQKKMLVSHATVFRRLNHIEGKMGVRLFDRFNGVYTLTAAGHEVANTANRIESEILNVARRVAGEDCSLSGVIKVATTDSLFRGVLASIFSEFMQQYHEIEVEVVVSNFMLDISRHEADVAIFPETNPPESLIGRKVGVIQQAIYGHKDYLAGRTTFQNMSWVATDEASSYRSLDKWMTLSGFNEKCRLRVNSINGMQTAICCGVGVGVLPCYLANLDPNLVRCGDVIDEMQSDLWLLTHRDYRRVTKVIRFMDHCSERLKPYFINQ